MNETFKVIFCSFLFDFLKVMDLKTKIESLEKEKLQIANLSKEKIEELERFNKKCLIEIEENSKVIKDLKNECNRLEYDFEKANKNNLELIDTNHALERVY